MKKTLLVLLHLIVIASFLYSAENQIYIMPKSGAFGVYLGSDEYTGGDSYRGPDVPLEGHEPNTYVDDMIVATVTIGEIPIETELSSIDVRFSVDCPDGLYFVSQQGEGSRRPFELQVISKIRTSYEREDCYVISPHWRPTGEYKDDNSGAEEGLKITLSDSGHVSEVISFANEPTPSRDVDEGLDGRAFRWEPRYYTLIFDVILVLPFESISNTGYLSTPQGDYQLVQADDYTSLVTLNVSYNGNSSPCTIPFSGYYSINDTQKKEGSANLYVNPTAAAANLSIENDWGRAKTVASMNFLATYDSTVSSDYRVFLSASNDPNNESRYGFELVHEDVTPLQPHTNNNSIGYTLELSGTAGSYDPLAPVEFEGYAHIVEKDIVDENGSSSVKINPVQIFEDYSTNNYLNFSGQDKYPKYEPTVTYEYQGDINIIIDEPVDINSMMPGRYYSDIYVHVVNLGG